MSIRFVQHNIRKSVYNGLSDDNEKKEIQVSLHGNIAVSRGEIPGIINVTYSFLIGESETNPVMRVVTETLYEYTEDCDASEDKLKKECLPTAISKTRSDVEGLLKDYGMSSIILPENIWKI
jgi:hypothetical protein